MIEGVLTTPLGLTDGGQGAFVQDATAGIALYLSGDGWPALPTGTAVRLAGTTDARYGQATVRVTDHAQFVPLGPARGAGAARSGDRRRGGSRPRASS